jgi:glycosyltransferase involved in cell wall biosynthesis
MLTDYFESNGSKVTWLSFNKRGDVQANDRQHYFPSSLVGAEENSAFLSAFVRKHDINVIINQEGNVNLHVPLDNDLSNVARLTVLHFNPNYISDNYFKYRIIANNYNSTLQYMMYKVLNIPLFRSLGLKHLRGRLCNNYKYQIANCDSFVMLSDYFRPTLAHLLATNDLPVNISALNNPCLLSAIESSKITNKAKEILYVGRLELGQKRLDLLLKVWAFVMDKHEDWNLVIVGDGPHKQKIQEMACQLGLKRITFAGHQNPTQYYERASLFCMTSDSQEGWGLVLVEAQAKGCVPLAFDSFAALHDIITPGYNGEIVEEGNINQYAEKISALINDSEKRNIMAENCIASVSRFSLDNIGRQWDELINKILLQKNRR